MGTEVQQFKMFFLGHHFANDVNDKSGNRSLLLGCSNSTLNNGNQFTGLSTWSNPDLQLGCEKEKLRQMILTQESVFRHQLNELHRLYNIQRDLMNEIKSKDLRASLASTSTFPSTLFSSSDKSQQQICDLPLGFPSSRNIPTSGEAGITSQSKVRGTLVRRLFDLELPAEECTIKERKFPPCSRSDLAAEGLSASTSADIVGRSRERVQWLDHSASLQASFHERVKTGQPTSGGSFLGQSLRGEMEPTSLLSDHQSTEMQAGRKLFGVEICHRNASTGSSMSHVKSIQSPQIIEDGVLCRGPREGGSSYQMSTDSLLINFHQFVGMNKTKPSIPLSLIQDSSSATGTTDSGKRKVEVNGCSGNAKSVGSYVDKFHSAGRVGFDVMEHSVSPESAASDKQFTETNMNARRSSSREFFDLNVCPTEEDASSTLCSENSSIKHVRGDIDLETPAQETDETPREESTDSKQGSSGILDVKLGEEDDGLQRVAAETLVNISSICADSNIEQIFPDKSEQMQSEILQWFAEIITSPFPVDPETDPLDQGTHVPVGMDYFEFATLNLAETEVEELSYKPPILEEPQENVPLGRPPNGPRRRGRQKKDFQRDVLPGLTSLSRNEVSEDLQTIEGLIKARSGASRTGPSQQNGASKGSKPRGRTKKRNFGGNDMMNHSPAVEKPECRDRCIEEGALMGWGKRARRPKRARCSAAIHSVPLKEVF